MDTLNIILSAALITSAIRNFYALSCLKSMNKKLEVFENILNDYYYLKLKIDSIAQQIHVEQAQIAAKEMSKKAG